MGPISLIHLLRVRLDFSIFSYIGDTGVNSTLQSVIAPQSTVRTLLISNRMAERLFASNY